MATISQIAAELGLAKSTVSRALRGVPSISESTIAAVRETAERLGYVPSVAAAGLSTGKNQAVGVVVPSLNRWFYSSVVSGIDRTLADAGYDVVLFDLDRSHSEGTRVFARSLLRRRVDALIVVAAVFTAEELAEFALLDIPMVAVGPPTAGLRTIGVDDAAIMTAATEHVIGLGHRALGLLGGYDTESLTVYGAAEREHAFMRAALRSGAVVDPTWMLSGGYRSGLALQATAPVFRGRSWPTALVCASDEMAFGAMYAIQQAGLRVPEDVSVVGIDGHEYAEAFGLTTCEQNPQAQGAEAARQLLAEMEGESARESFPPAEFSLVVRGSTGPPRRDRG
jgi:LacI family transcriptional regulator, repressor for deo operon, udp, cdd, tsx, nupC, and nupG